jgi:excisionase family DNA binding protein
MTKYLKVPEAAKLLGISDKATWQRLYRGEIPHRRWGRRILIPLEELEKFLAALPAARRSAVNPKDPQGARSSHRR